MTTQSTREPILSIRDLVVEFSLRQGILRAVDHASLDVYPGELLAVVGESGSGKSTLAYALLNLVSSPGKIAGGQVIYGGKDVLRMDAETLRQFRWNNVAMVFQAAQNALNPVMKVGDQMVETVQSHENRARKEILAKAGELLKLVRLQPERVLDAYPHELSGGMRQRVIVAMALLLDPRILVLDEPTTALDVVTQAYLLEILQEVRERLGVTMMFMTHDIALVAKVADRMAVMYAGKVAEVGSVMEMFDNPLHPYTRGLIKAAPSLIGSLKDRRPVAGSPPNLINPPSGCRFHPRCPHADRLCSSTAPEISRTGDRIVACHHWVNLAERREGTA